MFFRCCCHHCHCPWPGLSCRLGSLSIAIGASCFSRKISDWKRGEQISETQTLWEGWALTYKLRLQYKKGPKKPEFIYKRLYTYSYMFKLQSPSKYSPFDAIYLLRCFFHCSKQFLNSLILTPFSASAIFLLLLFPIFRIGKMFPFEDFFYLGKQNKSLGWDRMNREGAVWGSCCFWSKTAEYSVVWGGMLIHYPPWYV